MRVPCGRLTRKGTPCKLWRTNGGPCPTHNVRLAERNRRVRENFARTRPGDYLAHQIAAGIQGWNATVRLYGAGTASQTIAAHRMKNPPRTERKVLKFLRRHKVAPFEREYGLGDGSLRTIDVCWPDQKFALEINGHQWAKMFGEVRQEKHNQKVRDMEKLGWFVFVLDTRSFTSEFKRLEAELEQAGLWGSK